MHTGGSDTMDPVSCIFCPDRPSDSTSATSIREVGAGLRKASSRRNRVAIYSIRDLGRRESLVISDALAGSGMVFHPSEIGRYLSRELVRAPPRAAPGCGGAGAKPEVF